MTWGYAALAPFSPSGCRALVVERLQGAEALADLKAERGSIQVRASIAESEAMPLHYTAELLGMGTDDEKAIRWLIALMVMCCPSAGDCP